VEEPLYIGLMSGTSADGVDAVLAAFGDRPRLLGHRYRPFPETLHARIRALARPGDDHLDALGELDGLLAEIHAETVLDLLAGEGLPTARISALGCHGQTLRHRPGSTPPFSLQAGDPNRLALRTGIRTVADFRRKDIAAGGQGAPLVPPFHAYCFRTPREDRAVLNLGGIANLTLLPADPGRTISGFDTGPANTLLDAWCRRHRHTPYDPGGAWGAAGRIRHELLDAWVADPWFARPPPKSTGPEWFNLDWIQKRTDLTGIPPEDVQASLAALTAVSVARALTTHFPEAQRLLVCGGGVHNAAVMAGLREALPGLEVTSTAHFGLPPSWIEAAAFAWLARERLAGRPGNLPEVTGASRPVVLGAIYEPD